MSDRKEKIVIVGGSFGGINAAYALRRRLGNRAEITLISKDAEFTFLPSLPWVILGRRVESSISSSNECELSLFARRLCVVLCTLIERLA